MRHDYKNNRNIVDSLNPVFSIELTGEENHGFPSTYGYIRHYGISVTANVMGTDRIILEKRHKFHICFLKVSKRSSTLIFDYGSSSIWNPYVPTKPIKLHKEFRSRAALMAIRKVQDYIAWLIAPQHIRTLSSDGLSIKLFEEINNQLTCIDVLKV